MSNSVLNRAMAAAVLRMRGVAGEPLDFKVYPGAIVVIAPDGRKFNAGLDAVREFIDREQLDAAGTDESGEAEAVAITDEDGEAEAVAITDEDGEAYRQPSPDVVVGAAKKKRKGAR